MVVAMDRVGVSAVAAGGSALVRLRQRPDEAKWGAGLVMIGILVYLFSKSGEGKGKKR